MKKVLLAFSLSLLLLVGCATTQFTNLWHDPNFQGPKLNKILVLGVFENDTRRRSIEQTFVDSIDAKGQKAVASYTIAAKPEDLNSKEKVIAALNKVDADSLLIIRYKGKEKEEVYVQPSVDYMPSMRGYGYYGYYGPSYSAMYSPGYTKTNSITKLETRVYALSTEKLVWASESESLNPKSAEKVTKELAGIVVSNMRKNGIID